MSRITHYLTVAVLLAALSGCASSPRARSVPVDLTSPGAAVISFTNAAARGETEAALSCCLPGGIDYEDIRQILTATPTSPEYVMRQFFESVDPDAPIVIVSQTDQPDGSITVVWRLTFRRAWEGYGERFARGATFDLDGTLKRFGDQWLIDGI